MNSTTTTLSAAAFRRRAERAFLAANPGADVAIEWTWLSRPFTGRGDRTKRFRNGRFTATAAGYRTTTVHVSAYADGSSMQVRPS